MKIMRKLAAALIASSFLSLAAFAADLTGSWKWTTEGRNGPMETTAKFSLAKDGSLTGSVAGRQGDTPIGDASFKDGVVAFTVTREFHGHKIVIKYQGKFDGDTITGSMERPTHGGGSTVKSEWKATRTG
jgi:hypothetical protein